MFVSSSSSPIQAAMDPVPLLQPIPEGSHAGDKLRSTHPDRTTARKEEEEKEKEKEKEKLPWSTIQTMQMVRRILPSYINVDSYSDEELAWARKVMTVLRIVRVHRMSEYDPKLGFSKPIHFCNNHTIAFFDFKRESNLGCGQPLHELTSDDLDVIEHSVNVISLKVLESDVGYPISVYGTVVARDQLDYRCVYLFRRDRNDSQVITSPNDTLILTGPYRGLSVKGSMYFEIYLKIKDGGAADKAFSVGVIEHITASNAHTNYRPRIYVLTSHMSTVEFVYAHVPKAVEATLAVNILEGPDDFYGKITAWTSEDKENHILLYDSEAAGTVSMTGEGRSVALTRRLVAVPLNKKLVLNIHVADGGRNLYLKQSDQVRVCNLGCYVLQVKVTWTGGMLTTRRQLSMEHVAGLELLL